MSDYYEFVLELLEADDELHYIYSIALLTFAYMYLHN